jgi:hypothetical protein
MEIYNMFKDVPYMNKNLLKSETLDRLDSVVYELPKYKNYFNKLNNDFTIDNALKMLNIIDRDKDFKLSKYYIRFNQYFDEIEELIHEYGY